MSKKIESYEDLLSEKARLEELLKAQKTLVYEDFGRVKEGLIPIGHTVSNVYSFVSQMTTRSRSKSPLLNLGVDFGIEILVKRILLAKSGWLTRFVIPFIVKNYSSHLLADANDKRTLWKRVKSVFGKERRIAH